MVYESSIGFLAFGHLAAGLLAVFLVIYFLLEKRRLKSVPREWWFLVAALAIFSLHGLTFYYCYDSCGWIAETSVALGVLLFGVGAIMTVSWSKKVELSNIEQRIKFLESLTQQVQKQVLRGALDEREANKIIGEYKRELAELEVKREQLM
ncbi:MAG TPA: hypothetical protein VGQ00_02005 [Candidatus Norongarragalinales archaeon]|jgi:hypothetical protein|nr:hypothetical protein [Candidatus Norongarragalinales archaeon]